MANLLAYLACEKVSVERDTNNASIMGILETFNLQIQPGGPTPPPQTLMPMNWAVYCLWQKEPDDAGQFMSHLILFGPNGDKLMETAAAEWTFKEGQFRHQVISQFSAFPIWTPGILKLALMVKKPGDKAFQEHKSLHLQLRYMPAPANIPNTAH